MSDARHDVLARVRTGSAAQPATEPAPHDSRVRPAPPLPELLGQFTHEAEALGCVIHGPLPNPEVGEAVLAILRELHAHSLLAWGAPELPALGLGDALIERGFHFLEDVLPPERAGRAAQLARLDAVDVGLTGALAGLADTGSLVLASGAGRARLAWLLAPVHIALLPVRLLYPALGDFLAARRDDVLASANVAVVSGPSRSGDIEQVLTRGVHGPGAVHVVLIA